MKISDLLVAHFAYYGKQSNIDQIKMWASDLADLSPVEVAKGIQKLQRDPKRIFPATPAMIRRESSGFIDAEEAWATVPKNENASCVMTSEMAAAVAIAMIHIRNGDHVAARMAFKEHYENSVEQSLSEGKKAVWFASFGHDIQGRDDVLVQAVQKGRLSINAALSYNPCLQIEGNQNHLAIAAPSEEMSEEKKQQRLLDLDKLIKNLGKKIEN